MAGYAQCPRCSSTQVGPVESTWWGGGFGTRLLTHVACGECGATFNGRTGTTNLPFIVLYAVALFLIGLVASAGIEYAIIRASWLIG